MSGLNGKGTEGQGFQAGRGLGKCNPNNHNSDNQTTMEDFFAGHGRRRGIGFGFNRSENVGRGRDRGLGRFNQKIPRGLPRGFLTLSPEFQGRCQSND